MLQLCFRWQSAFLQQSVVSFKRFSPLFFPFWPQCLFIFHNSACD
uniref:Uncharacterized protein n=1 Tax=Rhizophora mucronata TaxID=61149 RepID=A0A2P2M8Z6_RHIMU